MSNDIHKIVVIAQNPVEAKRFRSNDESVTLACKILCDEGHDVILITSSTETIIPYEETSLLTYIEPLTFEHVKAVLYKEKPNALLPIFGGKNALNITHQLAEAGILKELEIEIIGTDPEIIDTTEDIGLFRTIMVQNAIASPKGRRVRNAREAEDALKIIGFPCAIQTSFPQEGLLKTTAYNKKEYNEFTQKALAASIIQEIFVEEVFDEWKEFDFVVMCDGEESPYLVCGIAQNDTFNSQEGTNETVSASVRKFSMEESQKIRNIVFNVLRVINMKTGVGVVRLAYHEESGKLVVLGFDTQIRQKFCPSTSNKEFPMAKIAVKIAIGHPFEKLCREENIFVSDSSEVEIFQTSGEANQNHISNQTFSWEEYQKFNNVLKKLDFRYPEEKAIWNLEDAKEFAAKIGFPILMRPCFQLNGVTSIVAYDEEELSHCWDRLFDVICQSNFVIDEKSPFLLRPFFENVIEVDVTVIADGILAIVAAVMERIEQSDVFQNDFACIIPPQSLSPLVIQKVEEMSRQIALYLQVKGLLHLEFAIKNHVIYVLAIRPHAKHVIPFVSKVLGVSLFELENRIVQGEALAPTSIPSWHDLDYTAVKETVFPWARCQESEIPVNDSVLKSAGETMGIADDLGMAFAKAELGTGFSIPTDGNVYLSVCDSDKPQIGEIAAKLRELGFQLMASQSTGNVLKSMGFDVHNIGKITEGAKPNILDLIEGQDVQWIINIPSGKQSHQDDLLIRTNAIKKGIPLTNAIRGAKMMLEAIVYQKNHGEPNVVAIQNLCCKKQALEH